MKIVIPMAGTGDRFIKAGYKIPKPLIEVDGRPIIEHIVRMFPQESDFVFICNNKDLAETNIHHILKSLAPNCKIVGIEPHKKGPVHTVAFAFEHIKDEEEVIVNYCDFGWLWNYVDFKEKVHKLKCDGCIVAYKGFHPHSLGNTYYAYIRWDSSNNLIEIKEKEPFTDNRMNEYASSGTYYFKKGSYVKKYFKEVIDKDINKQGEYYISLVYNLLKRDRLPTYIYEIAHFLQWGTPEDIEEYVYWSNAFRFKTHKQENYNSVLSREFTMLVPLGGEGARFRKEGYITPKPLIEVSGKPMFVQALNDFPKAKKYVFLCRKEHIEKNRIDEKIHEHFPNSSIISINETTEGQAATCLLAEDSIDMEKPLFIASCDNGVGYSLNKFLEVISDPKAAAVIWTFRKHITLKRNPHMYGWVRTNKDDSATEVSCKLPISSDPQNDNAVIGSFYFKKAKYFFDSAKEMIKKGIRVNNEFYVDLCINEIINKGLTVKVFEVDKYLGWGVPNDFRTYQYWQSCFDKTPLHEYKKYLDEDFN